MELLLGHDGGEPGLMVYGGPFDDIDDGTVDEGVEREWSSVPLADCRSEFIPTRDTGPVIVERLRRESRDHALPNDDVIAEKAG
jgi:hypothetical protein